MRQWPMLPTQISDQALPKQENVPIRKITITIPSVMEGSKLASSSTVATVMQSPEK